MKKEISFYLALAAFIAVGAYFLVNKLERQKYFDFLRNLGFGDYWLSQMRTDELQALYIYITDYTQKGKMPIEDSNLDKRLLKIAGKYPAILNYK